VRPELIVLAPLAALAVALGGSGARSTRIALAATLLLLFATLAAPRVIAVSTSAGHLSIGGKSDYNLALAWRGARGVPSFDPSRSVYNNLSIRPHDGFPEAIPAVSLVAIVRDNPGRAL
jgi:hypothetical protein